MASTWSSQSFALALRQQADSLVSEMQDLLAKLLSSGVQESILDQFDEWHAKADRLHLQASSTMGSCESAMVQEAWNCAWPTISQETRAALVNRMETACSSAIEALQYGQLWRSARGRGGKGKGRRPGKCRVWVAMHDCQAVVQSSPAEHEVLAAQLCDFKVLHRWAPPAEAAGLASACRAGLASAAAKIQAAAVKILAEVVRGIRRISAADGRSLQRTLGSASMSRSRGATQRHLIEALCAPEATMTDLSDEKLTELHGKLAKVVEELQEPEEGGQEPLPWWRDATMADAGLEQYLVSRLTEVSDAVLSRVSEAREKLVQAFVLASEFVRGLPDMDQEVDAYLSRLRPCKNTLSERIGILRNLILRLDHLKVAVAKCVPKLDAVSSEALLSACKEACAEAAGCLRPGTESAAPGDIIEPIAAGNAAFVELHRSAQLCQLVLEGHLCMAAAITFHSALGPGCEHDKRKKC